MSRAGRKIHARAPWAIPGSNVPAPIPLQHSSAPPQPGQQPSTLRTDRPRPQEAKTLEEAADGFMQAAANRSIRLVEPRFRSTAGPWVRMGEFDIRIPPDVIIRTALGRSGGHVAVLAYLDSSREAGRVQVLVARPSGIKEMLGLMPEQLRQLREVFLGR